MLAREQPDVVCVCTPSGMHGAHAVLAMRAGAHVIVEKPMEITRPAMDQMLRVQEEMGVKMAVISQHRFDPASMQVHDLVTEGALGTLVMGVASIPWWRSQAYYDSGAWRGTWALDGGGVLMNQGIHSIDLLQWLMGPVRSLTAYTQTRVHRMETEDVAVAILRFAGGALGAITGTTGAYPGVTTRIDVYGDRGSAVIENDRLGFLRLARDAMEEAGAYGIAPGERATAAGSGVQDPRAVPANTHALQIADMVAAIREDRPPLLDGQGARRAVDIILAIYESARSGREVDVP
jgi:predicted dehydrogenase